jgi:hypothetical protein
MSVNIMSNVLVCTANLHFKNTPPSASTKPTKLLKNKEKLDLLIRRIAP